jgi:hypothetical protein
MRTRSTILATARTTAGPPGKAYGIGDPSPRGGATDGDRAAIDGDFGARRFASWSARWRRFGPQSRCGRRGWRACSLPPSGESQMTDRSDAPQTRYTHG